MFRGVYEESHEQKPVHTFTKLWSLDVALSVKALNDMTTL